MDGLPHDSGPAMSNMSDSDCMGGVHRFASHQFLVVVKATSNEQHGFVCSVQYTRTSLTASVFQPSRYLLESEVSPTSGAVKVPYQGVPHSMSAGKSLRH